MSHVLSEQAARDWVEAREWKKGEPYVRGLTHLSVRPAEAAQEYRAQAHGQEAYRVSVRVGPGRIGQAQVQSASCSCPVGAGGGCKHVAALLNRLSNDSGAFVKLPALETVLDDLDAPALRRLVGRMLAKAPELETLLYAQVGQTLPADDFAPRIAAAFHSMAASYDHTEQWDSEDGPDTEAIEALLTELERRREGLTDLSEDEAAALTRAYLAVLDGVDSFYEQNDMDYGLDDVQEEGLLGLYDLFVNADLEGDLREDALEAVRNEIASHRADFGRDEFFDFYSVLHQDERRSVYDLIETLSRQSASYRRRTYLNVLIELRGGEPTEADTEALLRADHDPTPLILFLLERGRVGEALQALPKRRVPFATLRPAFEKAAALGQLEEAALRVESWEKRDALLWLHDLYRETGRGAQAYRMAQVQSQQNPHAEWFSRLKKQSPDWEKDRAAVIKALWKSEAQRDELLKLVVAEHLTEQAFDLVKNEKRDAGRLLRVARMPELDAQRAALLLIRAGQQLIAPRQRDAYAQAAGVLKELIPRVGQDEAKALVATHFPERQKLPALRDELGKAGLL
ncbi:SWIM zinc finger family protein [Deinococcus fonticola]|uniref:SWIM zinc finger family protein n=1 Tax=Deinococcus fonticola TaxID=2528713 RepID=UPI001074D8D8|nr:SWIM zinc finger family protein [Deinococcus fonticola]